MRKTLQATSIVALLSLIGVAPAVAAPGDVNAHIRDINRLCDMQRRGELSPSPSYCLPELPPGPIYEDPHSRR